MPITALAEDDDETTGWDLENGNPTVSHFGNAIQVWAVAQERDVEVNEAALAFNVRPELVVQAVEAHPWMFLNGDIIEHEGE